MEGGAPVVNRWRTLAIVLLLLIVVELLYLWKNWALIQTAYKNRKIIADAGSVAGGLADVKSLVGDVKHLFQ